jgi:hypothetical protein
MPHSSTSQCVRICLICIGYLIWHIYRSVYRSERAKGYEGTAWEKGSHWRGHSPDSISRTFDINTFKQLRVYAEEYAVVVMYSSGAWLNSWLAQTLASEKIMLSTVWYISSDRLKRPEQREHQSLFYRTENNEFEYRVITYCIFTVHQPHVKFDN